MLLIDKYAYLNSLKHIHPIEKMTLAFSLLVFTSCVKDNLISLITFLVMSCLIIFAAKIPIIYYLKLLVLPGLFLASGIIPILFSVSIGNVTIEKSVWEISIANWKLGVTISNLTLATQLIFAVLSSISCLYFLILTTPVEVLLNLFRKWKFPPLLIELMEMTYRSIFIFMETALTIYQAQKSRVGYRTIKDSIHTLGLLISSLFAAFFQRSKELNIAMEARSYDYEQLSIDEKYHFSAFNWGSIFTIIVGINLVYLLYGGQ